MKAPTVHTFTFEEHDLTFIEMHGIQLWIALEVGVALEYAGNGNKLPKNIGQRWAEDFRIGTIEDLASGKPLDGLILVGLPLKMLKKVGTNLGPTFKFAPSILLLTESGVYKAKRRAQTPAARRFENWLDDEVLPAIRKTGTYSAPAQVSTEPDAKLLRAQAQYNNAQARLRKQEAQERQQKAEGLAFLREQYKALGLLTPESEAMLVAKQAETLSGQAFPALLPPDPTAGWLSPTQIAEKIGPGVSVAAIGRAITHLSLKGSDKKGTEGLCRAIVNHSKGENARQVTTYLYSPEAVTQIEARVLVWLGERPKLLAKYNHARTAAGRPAANTAPVTEEAS